MLHTTFRKAKTAEACIESYKKFAKHKGGLRKWGKDTPFGLDEVLEVCGLNDALWCLQIVTESADREIRLFACDCAERVLPLYEKQYPNDKRPRRAIEMARKFANRQATQDELAAAWDAAGAAAGDAAGDAAGAAAWAAAWAAASDAALAALAAAWDAAGAAEQEWQKERLLEMMKGIVSH